jgi:excisionase family DNA binding protein
MATVVYAFVACPPIQQIQGGSWETGAVPVVADLLSPDEVAALLRVPVKTLAQWRYLGTGPRYAKLGRHIRYRAADLDTWLEAQLN